MKKNIYIWGAGEKLDLVYHTINQDFCKIIGIIDSDERKCGSYYEGVPVIEYDREKDSCDYIIVSVVNYGPICKNLNNIGVDMKKVVCFWENNHKHPELFDFLKGLGYTEQQKNKYKNRLRNLEYENTDKRTPTIIEADKTLRTLMETGCSLARFGDGEWDIILGKNRSWFQNSDVTLSNRLREVLGSKREDVMIAIADNFSNLDKYTEEAADGIREYMVNRRDEVEDIIDYNRIYYNAYVTRPYMIYKDKSVAATVFSLFKKIWEGRNVLLVEGYKSRIGVNNDLFNGAKSLRRILCPQENCWIEYDSILESVKRHATQSDLICISLGAVATVLAYDLSLVGFQALDIGQIDNEYEWFVMKVIERTAIRGKMVSEIGRGVILEVDNGELEGYYESVIDTIGAFL